MATQQSTKRRSKSKPSESTLPDRAGNGEQLPSRVEAFQRLAQANARGECVMLPRALTGHERRLHVRQTIREDHQSRILQRAEDAPFKFEKLAGSLFAFFRGTALLFYRDIAGEDAWMPTVLTLGDVHPANFGVMPNANNVPIFAVNDFDEAYYAPFTWDLKRGTTGFLIATGEIAGYDRKLRCKIARCFVRGYIDGVRHFGESTVEQDYEVRLDNAPPLVRALIENAQQDRRQWLLDDYLDEFKRGFRSDGELVPLTSRRDEFQALIDQLVRQHGVKPPPRAGKMRVKDVAMRRGQGTASLGLPRYYVLIEGPRSDGCDDLIIEFKLARQSALAGLTPPTDYGHPGTGDRIADAQATQLVRGDLFFGAVEFEGRSFMSRERAPFRDDMDLESLSKSQWKAYAGICGRALAHAHALSDDLGQVKGDIEARILAAIGPPRLFVDDIVEFAAEAVARLQRDYRFFCEDHARAAFRTVQRNYN